MRNSISMIAIYTQATEAKRSSPAIAARNSHKPAHSPSIFPSGTFINGILCSPHNATTNFLYASSSQDSLRTHICAWRRSRALLASRRPRARPSWMRASLRTPFSASRTDIWPDPPLPVAGTSTSSAGAGEVGSSPSDCNKDVSKESNWLRGYE